MKDLPSLISDAWFGDSDREQQEWKLVVHTDVSNLWPQFQGQANKQSVDTPSNQWLWLRCLFNFIHDPSKLQQSNQWKGCASAISVPCSIQGFGCIQTTVPARVRATLGEPGGILSSIYPTSCKETGAKPRSLETQSIFLVQAWKSCIERSEWI